MPAENEHEVTLSEITERLTKLLAARREGGSEALKHTIRKEHPIQDAPSPPSAESKASATEPTTDYKPEPLQFSRTGEPAQTEWWKSIDRDILKALAVKGAKLMVVDKITAPHDWHR